MAKERRDAVDKSLVARVLHRQTTEEVPSDEEALTRWPTLWSLLTTRYPDEHHVIEPASLTVRMGAGTWLWSVTSRDLKCSFSGFGFSLSGILDNVETELQKPDVQYRRVGKGDLNLRKRKKDK